MDREPLYTKTRRIPDRSVRGRVRLPKVQTNQPTSMGQEAALAAEIIANWKQIGLAFGGFIVRLLWLWERPVKWIRIFAGLLFMFGALYFNEKRVPHDYREEVAVLIGLFTNNIITTLFKFYKVNEDGLIDKARTWWQSDKHE